MKIIAFGVREDEECFMDPVAKKLNIEVEIHTEHLNMETYGNSALGQRL